MAAKPAVRQAVDLGVVVAFHPFLLWMVSMVPAAQAAEPASGVEPLL